MHVYIFMHVGAYACIRKSLMGAGRKGSGPKQNKNMVFDVSGLPFRGLECLDGCLVFFNMYCDVQLVAL